MGNLTSKIDWSKQHCGVHQAPYDQVILLMPDLVDVLATFPDDQMKFTWDVKVHMLMPGQYPCIPNWHTDFVPREGGVQKFDKIKPQHWHRFTQLDEHRGLPASEFTWRAFIRATHFEIQKPKASGWLRRHSQVYLNAETYQW